MVTDSGVSCGLFAAPRIVASPGGPRDARGTVLLRSADALRDYPVTVVHSLRTWAEASPGHPLVAERGPDGAWQSCSYRDAVAAADSIGQALLDRGLGPGLRLLILSGNSVPHLLLTLGALTAGVPVAPVSVAYALQSRDHARIRAIMELIQPGAVFADDAGRFAAALDAAQPVPAIVATGRRPGADELSDLLATEPGPALRAAFGALGPDTVAKILVHVGLDRDAQGCAQHAPDAVGQSADDPAGVAVPGRRATGDRGLAAVEPHVRWQPQHGHGADLGRDDLRRRGPSRARHVRADGPQSHRRPAHGVLQRPGRFRAAGAGSGSGPGVRGPLLLPAAADLQCRRRAAGLRARLADVAQRTAGHPVPVTGSWGATETGPAVTTAHFEYADARCIGVPLPGAEVKLVPAEDGYEIRARGPMVTPGYYGRADLTAQAFDDDGFYRTGDAVALADPADPNAGLLFRGRIAEDFKLDTGTFVRVGALRAAVLSAAPILADLVITGENRSCVGALAWLNAAEAGKLLGDHRSPPVTWSSTMSCTSGWPRRWPSTTRRQARPPASSGSWCWPSHPTWTRGDYRQGLCQPADGAGPPGRACGPALHRPGSPGRDYVHCRLAVR